VVRRGHEAAAAINQLDNTRAAKFAGTKVAAAEFFPLFRRPASMFNQPERFHVFASRHYTFVEH
jgi:hypothetical protein